MCKKIVTPFSHSWSKKQQLTKAQLEKGLPEHSLVTDCPARWGSQQKMVNRILEQEAGICQVLSNDRKVTHLIPSWQEVMVLESISAALTPLQDFTDMLSSVSAIKPLVQHLRDTILTETEDQSELTGDIKHRVLAYLNNKYDSPSINKLLDVCSFLDPRFKLDYIGDNDVVDVKARVQAEAISQAEKRSTTVMTPTTIPNQQQHTAESVGGDASEPQSKRNSLQISSENPAAMRC